MKKKALFASLFGIAAVLATTSCVKSNDQTSMDITTKIEETTTSTVETTTTSTVETTTTSTVETTTSNVVETTTTNVVETTTTTIEETKYTVTFINEKSIISTVDIVENESVLKPDDPIKEGYTFLGWYSDSEFNLEYDFSSKVTSDIQLYARFKQDELKYELSADGTYYIVTEMIIDVINLIIPEEYHGLPVKKIKDSAFKECIVLESVTIAASIDEIGEYAFQQCNNLTKVTILGTNLTIGSNSFGNCRRLVEIYNLSNLALEIGSNKNGYIAYRAKVIHTSLEEASCIVKDDKGFLFAYVDNKGYLLGNVNDDIKLTLPSCFTYDGKTISEYEINEYAFFYSNLISVTIPSSVSAIGDNAFYQCFSLVEVYNLSDISLTLNSTDNGYAAYYAKKINTTEAEASRVILIDDEFIFYLDGDNTCLLKYMGSEKKPNLPESFSYNDTTYNKYSIYSRAFYNNGYISEVIIPSSVTALGERAFYGCDSLTSITIPTSVKTIEKNAYACDNLNKLYYNGTIDDWFNIIIGENPTTNAIDFYLLDNNGTVEYNNTKYSLVEELIIPDTITEIKKYKFNGFGSIKKLTLSNNIKYIKTGAFVNTGIKDVYYNGTVENWCNISFIGVAFLNDVNYYFVDNNGTVEYNNTKYSLVREIEIPDTIKSIGKYQFYGFTNLLRVTIPSSVVSIGTSAFTYCIRLVEVYNLSTINLELKSYENGYVSYYAKVIHTSKEEEAIKIIEENGYMFTYVNNLGYLLGYFGNDEEITLPDGFTYNDSKISEYQINNYAFYRCSNLKKVIIPDNVTFIGTYAFEGCTNLTSVKLPNGIININNSTFNNCSNLVSIIIPASIKTIASNAFFNDENLSKVYYLGTSSKKDSITINLNNAPLKNATWYYFTLNGANETASGNWWYYDTDGVTIIEKIV